MVACSCGSRNIQHDWDSCIYGQSCLTYLAGAAQPAEQPRAHIGDGRLDYAAAARAAGAHVPGLGTGGRLQGGRPGALCGVPGRRQLHCPRAVRALVGFSNSCVLVSIIALAEVCSWPLGAVPVGEGCCTTAGACCASFFQAIMRWCVSSSSQPQAVVT